MRLPDWEALNVYKYDYEEKLQWLENMLDDAIERPKLLLFHIEVDTHDFGSEYGCFFLVAAKEEAEARKIVEEDMKRLFDIHYLACSEVGFAHAEEAGVISRFIT